MAAPLQANQKRHGTLSCEILPWSLLLLQSAPTLGQALALHSVICYISSFSFASLHLYFYDTLGLLNRSCRLFSISAFRGVKAFVAQLENIELWGKRIESLLGTARESVARYHTFLHFVFSCLAWQSPDRKLAANAESVLRDTWNIGTSRRALVPS